MLEVFPILRWDQEFTKGTGEPQPNHPPEHMGRKWQWVKGSLPFKKKHSEHNSALKTQAQKKG